MWTSSWTSVHSFTITKALVAVRLLFEHKYGNVIFGWPLEDFIVAFLGSNVTSFNKVRWRGKALMMDIEMSLGNRPPLFFFLVKKGPWAKRGGYQISKGAISCYKTTKGSTFTITIKRVCATQYPGIFFFKFWIGHPHHPAVALAEKITALKI